mgnify:CR=1 FL=1
MKKCIITVVGKDNVGIIAKVTAYIADTNMNVLNISQTIVNGYFNMIAIVDATDMNKDMVTVAAELEKLGNEIGVSIQCQREEIFEKMHRL